MLLNSLLQRTVSHNKGTNEFHHVSNVEVKKPSGEYTQCLLILMKPQQTQSVKAGNLKPRKVGLLLKS